MSFVITLLAVLVVIISLLLIGLVLIQRGRGGGLAGAFGGAGGSSAFGTKAGDVFTRITIGVAAAWFIILMLLVVLNLKRQGSSTFSDMKGSLSTRESDTGASTGTSDGKTTPSPILPAEGKSKADEPSGAPAPGATPPSVVPGGAAPTPPAETPGS